MKLNRRKFIKGTGGALAVGLTPMTISMKAAASKVGSTRAPSREALASPISELTPDWDVLVIGSGYGGSIMAAKLASHFNVAVLERGKEWQAGQFPDAVIDTAKELLTPANPLGLVSVTLGDDVDVLSASGLGGTSLMNANVLISPEDSHFNESVWPIEIQQDNANGKLQQYRSEVMSVLAPEQVATDTMLPKQRHIISTTKHLQEKGEAIEVSNLQLAVNVEGADNTPNPQGVNMNKCTQCGDCVTGCNVGAKKTLDTNYLPLAKSRGAKIFTQITVETVEKADDGRYVVKGFYVDDEGNKAPGVLYAKQVVVAGGSLGSTGILLRSQQQGNLEFSSKLGECFSGNGDVLGMNYNQKVQTKIEGFGSNGSHDSSWNVGPTLTTGVQHLDGPNGSILLEEGAMPSALVGTMRWAAALRAPQLSVPKGRRVLKDKTGAIEGGALNHSMIYLGMGKEVTKGAIALDGYQNPKVVWPGALSDPTITAIRGAMDRHTEVFGGTRVENPRAEWFGGSNLITVHPLGGCKLANNVNDGVANHKGQVFQKNGEVYDGLYVCDGAILPGAVGVNPMLTISLLAERIAEHFISDNS